MNPDGKPPIVLVHGFWVTPRSWEDWIAHYESRGLPRPRAGLSRLRGRGRGAQRRPVADRGGHGPGDHRAPGGGDRRARLAADPDGPLGRRGLHADPARPRLRRRRASRSTRRPPRACKVVPLSQIKATFPVLKNPANRHKAVGFTYEQWHYAFTNTFSEDESRRLYERYHIPASGAIFWGSVLANIQPGHQETWVDYRNDDRAPLLFISGSEDHLMPPKIQQSNAKHYKSNTITEVKEYEGRAHSCRLRRAGRRWPTTPSIGPEPRRRPGTLHEEASGSPTSAARRVLIEVAGWRLLTDPTFDPPGRTIRLRLGHGVAKVAGPAIPAAELAPIDAVLLSHDHHGDNLDDAGRALLPSVPRGRDHRRRGPAARRAAPAGSSRGTPRGSRRPGGRRSRSPPRPAATARRSAARSSAT